MESLYGDIDGAAIWQSVEDYVKKLFKNQTIKECIGWFPHCFENTKQLIEQYPDVIYQPWFKYADLMIRCDFLVLNEENKYDLWEVKAKNSVKKNNDIVKDDLNHDISFQHYVLTKALWEKFSWHSFLIYLNKEFKKKWHIVAEDLLIKQEVTEQLFDESSIVRSIQTIRRELAYSKEIFDQHHVYHNEDYITFFGEPSREWSIWEIPWINAKKKELYALWKIMIEDISKTDQEVLVNNKWEISRSMQYIDLYQQWFQTIINKEAIKEKMEKVEYPLFFYDYETVSSPIPFFDETIPWQHIVVQYSVHKVDIDGTITHHQWIITPWETSNFRILQQLQQDLEWWKGTYIVWFKGFENKRNEESAELFPELQDFFATVNQRTFDLMEIFSELLYFDKRFRWSSSIKKVLPVMSDLSYDHLDISNGALASTILTQVISWNLDNEKVNQHIKNLQTYCEQDTLAMVKIWEKLKIEIQ